MPICLALLTLLLASGPRASETPESLIQHNLLAPLAAREKGRSRYSRAGPPAVERRLRMLDETPIADAKGARFQTFTVDARYGLGKGTWDKGEITGCVYPASGEVYVKVGNGYRGAGVLLGKNMPVMPPHVCRPPDDGV